jgi:hypothetical protein
MGALGDLLELLHDAHAGVETFEVEFRDWVRRPASHAVGVSYSEVGKPQLDWLGGDPWATPGLTTRRIWLHAPDLLRVEILRDDDLFRLGVRNGTRWWRWDAAHGAASGEALPDERGVSRIPRMLTASVIDVRRLIHVMRFEPAGTGERAERTVLCARAFPRSQPPARGVLSYELEFDAEHGSLLRRAEFEDGEPVLAREAREVLYNSEIKSECFVFTAPDVSPSTSAGTATE